MTQQFKIGDEVFTRNPSTYVEGASCIIGVIDKITEVQGVTRYEFKAEVPVKTGPCQYETQTHRVSMPAEAIQLRPGGYKLSELDGRNGGNAAWIALSQSWGYD